MHYLGVKVRGDGRCQGRSMSSINAAKSAGCNSSIAKPSPRRNQLTRTQVCAISITVNFDPGVNNKKIAFVYDK